MADDPRYFFLKPPALPITEKHNLLGRLVKNYADPIADYTPNGAPSTLIPFVAPLITSHITSVESILRSSSSSNAQALISALAAFGHSSSSGSDIRFTSERLEIIRLQQHDDTFEALKQLPEVKEKLPRMLRVGGKVYFVVAIVCWKNARFEFGTNSNQQTSLNATAPVGSAALGAVTGVPATMLSGIGDVEFKINQSSYGDHALRATAEGEQIIGLEYRLIRRSHWGLGKQVKMGEGAVRYEGGRYYGHEERMSGGDEGEEDEDEMDEEQDELADLKLTDERVEGFAEN